MVDKLTRGFPLQTSFILSIAAVVPFEILFLKMSIASDEQSVLYLEGASPLITWKLLNLHVSLTKGKGSEEHHYTAVRSSRSPIHFPFCFKHKQ